MYLLQARREPAAKAPRVQLLGSGAILREVIAAADLLQERVGRRRRPLGLPELHRARAATGWRSRARTCCTRARPRRSPTSSAASPRREGPVVAATDYVRAFAEQIRPYVPRRYVVLGTDGFGRSDTREQLRRFFEVDRHHVDGRGAEGARRRGDDPGGEGGRGDREVRHRSARSRRPGRSERLREPNIHGHHRGEGPGDRRLQGRADHRGAREAGRRGARPTSLVTLESEKATMDVPSPAAGTVRS